MEESGFVLSGSQRSRHPNQIRAAPGLEADADQETHSEHQCDASTTTKKQRQQSTVELEHSAAAHVLYYFADQIWVSTHNVLWTLSEPEERRGSAEFEAWKRRTPEYREWLGFLGHETYAHECARMPSDIVSVRVSVVTRNVTLNFAAQSARGSEGAGAK